MTTTIDGRELTEPDLRELLAAFNADAKALSRRGWCGTATAEYADCHASIDQALTALGY